MTPEEKNNLNKRIRKYDGDNPFMQSIKSYLKKTNNRFEYNGRKLKCLSDKQYEVAINILDYS